MFRKSLLFRGLMKDPRCPRRSKALLVFAAAWIASPIDLIPEFIPFLGPLDDAIMAALVLRHLLKKADPEVIRDHWWGDPATIERLPARVGAASGEQRGMSPPAPLASITDSILHLHGWAALTIVFALPALEASASPSGSSAAVPEAAILAGVFLDGNKASCRGRNPHASWPKALNHPASPACSSS